MQITVKQRYKPFTHQPGAKALLPGTSQEVIFYPEGVEQFTALLDLEKGSILTFGKKFRKEIASEKKVALERLSFGVHKKQEWEGIYRRCNVEEFLPIWYHMGQWYAPSASPPPDSLMESCFLETDTVELSKHLERVFLSGFSNLLFPHAVDLHRYGFEKEPLGEGCDPTALFSLGRTLIRSFFFRRVEGQLIFLPLVPKGIHCGRFLNIREKEFTLDFEWSKHLPRRAVLRLMADLTLTFSFPKEIQSFRIKNSERRVNNQEPVFLKRGTYFLDKIIK